jgi:hypothetical protein
MCIHCGDPGEPCCATTTECNGTAVCDLANDINPMCAACGVTGNPCCAGNKCNSSSDCCSEDGSVQVGRCVATGSACRQLNSGGAGVCMHGNCQCGGVNEPCCGNPPTTCTANMTCSSAGCTM